MLRKIIQVKLQTRRANKGARGAEKVAGYQWKIWYQMDPPTKLLGKEKACASLEEW